MVELSSVVKVWLDWNQKGDPIPIPRVPTTLGVWLRSHVSAVIFQPMAAGRKSKHMLGLLTLPPMQGVDILIPVASEIKPPPVTLPK